MRRALELAARGRGAVEPNPMVGAVLVRDGAVIGEGWHQRFGGPHAEVEALAAARAAGAGEKVRGATLYVSLEPCCHRGKKTPPCAEALIAAGIARVVAAMEDPDPNVAGRGLAALRQAGVEVVVGVLEQSARQLLAAYVKLRTRGWPWVICKWAQSLDGRIATFTGQSKWLSGEASRRRVHLLRGQCDGVCVGVGTVKADDPLLTNRSGVGRQPARLVLDERLEIPLTCRLLASLGSTGVSPVYQATGNRQQATESGSRGVPPVIIATRDDAPADRADALRRAGAEVLRLPAGPGGVDLAALLDELGRRQWTHLLVEGGRGVLSSFIGQRLADELMVFVAPLLVGGARGLGPVAWDDIASLDRAYALPAPQVEPVDSDLLLRYRLST